MAEYTKVTSFVDLESTGTEKEALIKQIDEIIARVKSVGKIELSLSGAGSTKDALKAFTDLTKGQADLSTATKNTEKALLNTAKAEKLAAQAAKENAAATLLSAKASKENAAAKANEARASKENSAAKALDAKADKEATNSALLAAKASTENAKAKLLEQKYTENLTKEKEKLEKAAAAEEKRQEKLNNAYEQLKAKYLQTANNAKRLGAEMGINSQEFKDAAREAQVYYQSLIKIEEAVGQSQRKVGQYTNATFALSQILREAPAFAFSFQTGLLGISNNLPILTDEIKKLNEVTGSGFKSLAILGKSLFSITNIVTIGISVFTIFGKQIFEAITGTKDLTEAQKKLLETQRKVNDLFSERLDDFNGQQVKDYVKELQRALDLEDKRGISSERRFLLTKKQLELEKYYAEETQRLAIERAENDKSIADKRAKGVDALKAAYDQAGINYSIGLISQQGLLRQIEEAQAKGSSTKSLQKELDLLTLKTGNAKSIMEAYGKALNGVGDAQSKINELNAEESKFNADEKRKFILETAKLEVDITTKTNDRVLANDRSTLQEQLNALQSNLAAKKRLFRAENTAVQGDPTVSTVDKSLAAKKANNEILKAELDFQTETFNVKEDFRQRDLAAVHSAYADRKKIEADLNKELSSTVELSYDERLNAAKKYFDATQKLADAEYKLKLQQAGLSDAEIKAFQADSNYRVKNSKLTYEELLALAKGHENEILTLAIGTNATITEILGQELDKQRKLREESLADTEYLYEVISLQNLSTYAEDTIALNKSLIDKKISYEKYLKERSALDKKYQKQNTKDLIESLQAQLSKLTGVEDQELRAKQRVEDLKGKLVKATTEEQKKAISALLGLAQKELTNVKRDVDTKIQLQKKLAKATIDASEESTEAQIKNAAAIREATKQLLSEAVDAIGSIGSNQYEREKNQLQELIDLGEEKRQKDIDIANQTSATAAEAADRIAAINARADAQKSALERRQRQSDQERARFERAVEAARIIASTTVGVMNALSGPPPAPPNPVLAGIIGATGAIQLAKLLSTPIPRYATGLDRAEHDHWGITGDGGRREYVRYPDGTGYITPDKPTLTFIPKGASVKKSLDEAAQVYGHLAPGLAGIPQFDNSAAHVSAIREEGRKTREAILNKRENYFTIKNGVISMITRDGYNETDYLNNNLHFQ